MPSGSISRKRSTSSPGISDSADERAAPLCRVVPSPGNSTKLGEFVCC